HDRLVTVADVIREKRPLRGGPRLDDENRFGALADGDDDTLRVEDEAVAVAKHRAARERCRELDSAITRPASVHAGALLPTERDRVGPERIRARRLPIDALDDG